MNSSHVLIVSVSRSVMPDSLQPHGLHPTRLLHPWDFPDKSTGVGCHCLLHDKPRQHLKIWKHFDNFLLHFTFSLNSLILLLHFL